MKTIDSKIYRAFAAMSMRAAGFTWKAAGSALGVSDSSLRRDTKAHDMVVEDVATISETRLTLRALGYDAEKIDDQRLPGVVKDSRVHMGEGRFLKVKGIPDTPMGTPSATVSKAAPTEEPQRAEEQAPVPVPAAQVEPIKYLLTEHALVVIRDGKPLQVDRDHRNFDKIREALKGEQYDKVYDLIDMRTALSKYEYLGVEVTSAAVLFHGVKLDGRLSERLIDALTKEDASSLERLSKFLVRCRENPSFRVVSRIFDFMTANDIEIDEDGDILAFKVVRSNFFDKHSGTMDNSPGKEVSMPRNLVQDDDRITCSNGLHACSRSYIKNFGHKGDKLVLVKISPKDVVSIPTDYHDAKMRCCKYLVLKELETL